MHPLFALYIPSWQRAAPMLVGQGFLIGILAMALLLYSRQRHGWIRTFVALTIGLFAGLAVGLGWTWWCWSTRDPFRLTDRLPFMEWDLIAFFELGRSAMAATVGLLVGWGLLELVGLRKLRRLHLG
jgi:hypothetical protein